MPTPKSHPRTSPMPVRASVFGDALAATGAFAWDDVTAMVGGDVVADVAGAGTLVVGCEVVVGCEDGT